MTDPPNASSSAVSAEDAAGWVTARIGRTGFRTDATARTHSVIVDEPASVGGTDLGPRLYESLLTASRTRFITFGAQQSIGGLLPIEWVIQGGTPVSGAFYVHRHSVARSSVLRLRLSSLENLRRAGRKGSPSLTDKRATE